VPPHAGHTRIVAAPQPLDGRTTWRPRQDDDAQRLEVQGIVTRLEGGETAPELLELVARYVALLLHDCQTKK